MIILLSTLDNAMQLRETLDALTRVRFPARTRIYVIDNGSTDNTAAVLKEFQSRLPMVRHYYPVRGKNHCLNHVLHKVVYGLEPEELVVLTDDDVIPDADWLEQLDLAARRHPGVSVFAGAIAPRWPEGTGASPDCLGTHFGALFSITSHPEGPCDCTAAFGPNMAVRARVFHAGFRFDPGFGPNGGGCYPMGSETELMDRLDAAGHKAWFAAHARLRHIVLAEQLTQENIIRRARRHGKGCGWREHRGVSAPSLLAGYLSSARGIVSANVRFVVDRSKTRLIHAYHAAWARGYAEGVYLAAQDQPRRLHNAPERRTATRVHLMAK